MVKVLFVSHKFGVSLNPLFKEQLNLDREKFECIVCFLNENHGQRCNVEDLGYKTYYLNTKSRRIRWYNLFLINKIKRILDDEQIDVISCQQHRGAPLSIVAALFANKKPTVFITLHGLGFAKTLQRKVLNWLTYRRVRKVIGVSHGVRQDIVANNWNLPEEKVVTIQNGLDLSGFPSLLTQTEARKTFFPGNSSAFWIGTAGRLSEVKNHRNLIHAFARLIKNFPQSMLFIAGSGELESELKKLVSDLDIDGRVVFLGHIDDIATFLKSLDTFILPSLREGLPLALLEAMASALPVVGANVGGIPEIFGDEHVGRLVDPLDPADICAALEHIAGLNPAQRVELGGLARKRALTQFSAERMIREYEAVYAESC